MMNPVEFINATFDRAMRQEYDPDYYVDRGERLSFSLNPDAIDHAAMMADEAKAEYGEHGRHVGVPPILDTLIKLAAKLDEDGVPVPRTLSCPHSATLEPSGMWFLNFNLHFCDRCTGIFVYQSKNFFNKDEDRD
jgi:hypothetical protein